MADDTTEQPAQAMPPAPLSPEEYQFQREKYIEWADIQLARIHERHTLSGQELDKQIVALAGGGLALTLTLAKDVFDKGHAHLAWLAYLSWACFLVALAVNLLSHQIAADQYSVMMDRMAMLRSASVQQAPPDMRTYGELTGKIEALTPKLQRMNVWARRTTLAGIVLFAIFIADNQYYRNGKAPTNPPTSAASGTRSHQRAIRDQFANHSRTATDTSSATDTFSTNSGTRNQLKPDTMKKPSLTTQGRGKIIAAKGCVTATSEMLNPHMPPTPPPTTPPTAKKE